MELNKISTYLLVFYVSILGTGLSWADGQKSTKTPASIKQDTASYVLNRVKQLGDIDSLFVIHFHPEVQCSCCIKVGMYAKEGLEKFYAKPYKDSCIIFREYNIDEDSSTAKKYKIFWSALGFEKFSGEKNEFKEIESVWEICEDKEKFLPNFKKELDEFIKGTKKKKSKAKNAKDEEEPPPKKPN
jgi:hypothetical protein